MNELRYTLLSDGSSDQALLPILTWLLRQNRVRCAIQPAWADLRRMPRSPKTLAEKINIGLYLYPCDLLFVHRDAEKQPRETRRSEITDAVSKLNDTSQIPPAVCVIPVRMQEAWLLFDEGALRQAAGNPHGKQSLQLPPLVKLERLPDPKSLLHELLRVASGLHGRRLKQFSTMQSAQRVTALIEDFSLLRKLPAFSAVESGLRDVIKAQRWSLLAAD